MNYFNNVDNNFEDFDEKFKLNFKDNVISTGVNSNNENLQLNDMDIVDKKNSDTGNFYIINKYLLCKNRF